MNLEEVKQALEKGSALLLDVREREEWNKGHLNSATHVPLSKLDEGKIPSDLPTNKTLYIYCQRGGRATIGAQILIEEGFQAVPLKNTFEELKSVL